MLPVTIPSGSITRRRHPAVTGPFTASAGCHAAVTADAHHEPMLSAWRHSGHERAGALILRVWLEGGSGAPQLRVRMLGQPDLDRDGRDTGSASTIEETLAYVRDWLERFAASGRSGSA